jgi:hypothetical protein
MPQSIPVPVRDHTKLKNIGSNSHDQVDTHIAAATGVHNVGGSNVASVADILAGLNALRMYVDNAGSDTIIAHDAEVTKTNTGYTQAKMMYVYHCPGDDLKLGYDLHTENGSTAYATVKLNFVSTNIVHTSVSNTYESFSDVYTGRFAYGEQKIVQLMIHTDNEANRAFVRNFRILGTQDYKLVLPSNYENS